MHVRPALSDGSGRIVRSAATRTVARWAVTLLVGGAGLALGTALIGQQAVSFFTAGSVGSDQDRLNLGPLATRSVVYAADGSQLGIFHDEEYRVPVPLSRVPDHVKKAVLDAEDERFYDHGPLDLRAMARAMVNNLEEGGITEGGSTITQQLVKTVLLTSKQDVNRKLQEAALAIRLEDQMTKDEIFERYLNTVYFGNHSYGIQAAAERYYRTDVDKLTVGQAVLLAGLIRNPVYADPYGNPEAAKERRDVIVDRMVILGDLTPDPGRLRQGRAHAAAAARGRGSGAGKRLLHRVREAAAAQRDPPGRHRQPALPGRVPGRPVDPHHAQPRVPAHGRGQRGVDPARHRRQVHRRPRQRRPHQRGGAGPGRRQRLRPDQVQPGHRHQGPPDGVVVQAVHPGRGPRERAADQRHHPRLGPVRHPRSGQRGGRLEARTTSRVAPPAPSASPRPP